jgi:hypothetical protein
VNKGTREKNTGRRVARRGAGFFAIYKITFEGKQPMKANWINSNRLGPLEMLAKMIYPAAIAFSSFLAAPVQANTTYYWIGNDYGGDYWTYTGNWSDGSNPSSSTSSDVEFQQQQHNWNSTDNYGGFNPLAYIKIDSLPNPFILSGSSGNGVDLWGDSGGYIDNYEYNGATIDGLNLSLHAGTGNAYISTYNGDLTLQNAAIYAGDNNTIISFGGNS